MMRKRNSTKSIDNLDESTVQETENSQTQEEEILSETSCVENNDGKKMSAKRRKTNAPQLTEFFHIFVENGMKQARCKLCESNKPPIIKILKMTDANTSGVKRHLNRYHEKEFKDIYFATPKSKGFEQEIFTEKLLNLVAKKYLPFNFFDDEETQDLFQYLNPLAEIPKRNCLKSLIENQFHEKQKGIMKILELNASKISFTIDGWTSTANRSYYGITAHFIDDNWELHSLVLDFCPSHGKHKGKDIASCFFKVVKENKIVNKIMGITVDNAASNTTFMSELKKIVEYFDSTNQHFRCIAHILNLGVQDFLKILKIEERNLENEESDDEMNIDDSENLGEIEELEENDSNARNCSSPVNKLRSLFKIINKSEQLHNKLKLCCESCNVKMLAPNIDVKTRWNSTHDMIVIAIRMESALDLLCEHNEKLKKLKITEQEWTIFKEVTKYLRHFKVLTNLFSAEKTPTLNLVVIGINLLLDKLDNSINNLRHAEKLNPVEEMILEALEAAQEKIMKHYSKTNWTYCTVLILDPRFKIETFEKTAWGREMKNTAIKKFKAVLSTVYSNSTQNQENQSTDESNKSSNQLENTMDSDENDDIIDPNAFFEENTADKNLTNDWQREFSIYSSEKRADSTTDILEWWKNHQKTYPILSKMAKDYLSIQATSVSCERLFSRSALTVTKRRNRLHDDSIRFLMSLNSWATCSLAASIQEKNME